MNAHAPIVEAPPPAGHNNPPEATPFEAIRVHISDLMEEARNWCDGTPVETQAQADEVSRLMEEFRRAHQAADEARKAENKPFDDGKAAVQEKYAPLIADTKAVRGMTVRAIDALKAALTPYLRKLEDEKRAAALAAQEAAAEAARIASEAMRAAAPSDLTAREEAEAKVAEAAQAQADATKAAQDRAHAKGGSRATGLRSYWSPALTDAQAALRHYVTTDPDAVKAFLLQLAVSDVAAGKRTIPGFTITEERRA
jgi:hypothetical protein